MRFVFGMDSAGQSVVIDESISNVLIKGSNQKRREFYSWLIHNCKASEDVDYAFISKNEEPLKDAQPYKSFYKNCAVAFEQFFHEMQHRYETLFAQKAATIDDYNRKADIKLKRLLLLVEDVDLIRDRNPLLRGFIVSLLQKGRAVGIHLIIGSNRKREIGFAHLVSTNCSPKFKFVEE